MIPISQLEGAVHAIERVYRTIPPLPNEWRLADVDRRIRAADVAWGQLAALGVKTAKKGDVDIITHAGIRVETTGGRANCIARWISKAQEAIAKGRAAA